MNDFFSQAGNEIALNLGQTLILGLGDSLNPGGISGIVIFLVVMFWISREQGLFFRAGLSTLLGLWSAKVAQVLGIFDPVMASKNYDILLDAAYFILSVFSLVLGFVLLKDWHRTTRQGNSSGIFIRFPFLEKQDSGPSATRSRLKPWIYLPRDFVISMFFAGIFIELVMAAWAPNRNMEVMIYQLLTQKKMLSAVLFSMLYGVSALSCLWLLWLGGNKALWSDSIRSKLRQRITLTQIVFSAIFLSYGFTILYRYYYLV